ncbi:RMD1 family protein [Nafulsella turpanensis]|uniref:hypothetical protein n=1 Tax=Nafulsella turpanensis TaxID=1265690 RepID=UPI000348E3BC|nr:hypothetical protein [Nafulsella turpanensis]
MIKIEALQVAEQINLKQLKASFAIRQHSGGSSEQFYVLENDMYLYVLNYGVVVFGNYNIINIRRKNSWNTSGSSAPAGLPAPFRKSILFL